MGTTFSEKDQATNSELSNNSVIPVQIGDYVKRTSPSQLRMQGVAVCPTGADTQTKVATIQNYPDFTLNNGLIVTVYFQNKNTVTSPKLNVNNTGAFELRLENQASDVTIGNGSWGDGVLLSCQYVEVSTTQKYWLILGHNVASKTTDYTVLNDNTFAYNKGQVDNKISGVNTNINNQLSWKYKTADFNTEIIISNDDYKELNIIVAPLKTNYVRISIPIPKSFFSQNFNYSFRNGYYETSQDYAGVEVSITKRDENTTIKLNYCTFNGTNSNGLIEVHYR